MKRPLTALLLAAGLLLTGACSERQSGDSNSDSQVDQAPGDPGDQPSPRS